ncbi:hypothetical protein [Rhizobium sp. NXC24]|uniref:hypothetical protein n=1 Tax=Rhizobium sp. NXC24 TaxID=2048897 RepID=UPI000CDF2FE9|nr:hypothetical protein [Rhizobium sp. NXC24]AVA20662.1 hypothetical protein NXC24_CH00995 [Rhizobium sp. NXC24]
MTKNMAMTAVQGMILERLIEAMETDIALPVRVGPKAFGSSMPEYIHTSAENFARAREDVTETGGARTREDEKAERRKTERRAKCSRERVSRMEEAFDWVRRFIFDDEARQVLLAYAAVKARGWDWTRYLNNRNRRNPKKKAWVKRTVQRWIVKSLQIIDAGIRQSGIIWPAGIDLQVAHETAKHTGKSITPAICASG